jgi:hypothetical protein
MGTVIKRSRWVVGRDRIRSWRWVIWTAVTERTRSGNTIGWWWRRTTRGVSRPSVTRSTGVTPTENVLIRWSGSWILIDNLIDTLLAKNDFYSFLVVWGGALSFGSIHLIEATSGLSSRHYLFRRSGLSCYVRHVVFLFSV